MDARYPGFICICPKVHPMSKLTCHHSLDDVYTIHISNSTSCNNRGKETENILLNSAAYHMLYAYVNP